MHYEYVGCLEEFGEIPSEDELNAAVRLRFGPQDLSHWTVKDLSSEKDWVNIPVHRMRKESVIRFSGRFEEVRRMDDLPPESLFYWVPLGTIGWKDERLPVDLTQFPVLEVTYQCLTDNAVPCVVCLFPGSEMKVFLPSAPGVRTAAVVLSRLGFPQHLENIVLRLYSTSRATATVEIESISLRSLLPSESKRMEVVLADLDALPKPPDYSLLHEFMPLGVFMDAAAARRLAETLGISTADYWWLALEDIVKHHHNSIALTNLGQLTQQEQRELLSLVESYGVRLVIAEGFGVGLDSPQELEDFKPQAAPLANSGGVLAWQLFAETSLDELNNRIRLRQMLHEIDSRHPFVVAASSPSSLHLFARHFPVVSLRFAKSHAPWELGRMVATHVPASSCQHLWVYAPTFIGPTGAPEWSTCPEMRLMVNLGFACGARGWFSCAYHNDPAWAGGVWQRSLTGPFVAFSDLWAELNISMDLYNAIALLLLHASPEEMPPEWQIAVSKPGENSKLPEDTPPTSAFRLRGVDYDIFFFISNNIRGMTGMDISVPEKLVSGVEIHDLGDFVRTRKWAQMPLQRHIEMFPGQARILLVAAPPVCAWWKNLIAARLVEDDRRQVRLNIDLARAYGLDTRPVEDLLSSTEGDDVKRLEWADRADAMLVDLLYSVPEAAETRSAVIEALSIMCACDGALCRLLAKGKAGQAQDLGRKVISLAHEVATLRVALRKGEARGVAAANARDLVSRARVLLQEIRGLIEPPQNRHALHRYPL